MKRLVPGLLLVVAVGATIAMASPCLAQGASTNATNSINSGNSTNSTNSANALNSVNAIDSTNATNSTNSVDASNSTGNYLPGSLSNAEYQEIFKILFALLAVALILESALAVVFRWRLFLTYLDGRGVKSLVSAVVGTLVAVSLKFDVVQRLFEAVYGQPTGNSSSPGFGGELITGLVLAGGSAGVNNILTSLGFRSVLRPQDVRQKPAPSEAWIAVRLTREKTKGQGLVNVAISKDGADPELVGVIAGEASPPPFLRPFFNDAARFPTVGGHAAAGDHKYKVILSGKNAQGGDAESAWGPFEIAAGAIIDIELTL